MHVFTAAAEAIRDGRPAALVTVIEVAGSTPRTSGSRMLVHEDGSLVGTIGGGAFEFHAAQHALVALRRGSPTRWSVDLTRDLGMCCGGQMEVFIEPLSPHPRAVLFGAGHVCQALAPLLVAMDFHVMVVDDRDELATPERFPGCTLRCEAPLPVARAMEDDPIGFWLIATHDHKLDQDLGEALLPLHSAWTGMIGSKRKVSRFLVRYRAAGMPEAQLQHLRSPVGLDIGAETPAEIAVSIAAEVVAVKRSHKKAPVALSEQPLKARGGDGKAKTRGLVSAARGLACDADHVEEDAG